MAAVRQIQVTFDCASPRDWSHWVRRGFRLLPADDEHEACLVMQDVEDYEFCLD